MIHVEASFGGILSWCFFCSLYCFLLLLFSLAWLLRILHVIPTSILSLKPVLAFRVYFTPGTCTCCSFTEETFQVFFSSLHFLRLRKSQRHLGALILDLPNNINGLSPKEFLIERKCWVDRVPLFLSTGSQMLYFFKIYQTQSLFSPFTHTSRLHLNATAGVIINFLLFELDSCSVYPICSSANMILQHKFFSFFDVYPTDAFLEATLSLPSLCFTKV